MNKSLDTSNTISNTSNTKCMPIVIRFMRFTVNSSDYNITTSIVQVTA